MTRPMWGSKLMQLGDHTVIALPGFMGLRIFIARTLSPIPSSPIPYPLKGRHVVPSLPPHSFVTSSTTAWKVSIRASGVMP